MVWRWFGANMAGLRNKNAFKFILQVFILSQKHILGVKKVVWCGLDVVWGVSTDRSIPYPYSNLYHTLPYPSIPYPYSNLYHTLPYPSIPYPYLTHDHPIPPNLPHSPNPISYPTSISCTNQPTYLVPYIVLIPIPVLIYTRHKPTAYLPFAYTPIIA